MSTKRYTRRERPVLRPRNAQGQCDVCGRFTFDLTVGIVRDGYRYARVARCADRGICGAVRESTIAQAGGLTG